MKQSFYQFEAKSLQGKPISMRDYSGVNFPMFSKIDVNGENAHPLYKYLKKELKGTLGNKIKWNFTKFLISKDGKPLKRFAPTTKPEKIEKHIQKALSS